MPKNQLEKQILTAAENLLALDFTPISKLETQLPAWNNLNVDDFIVCVDALKTTLSLFEGEGIIQNVPWNILNSLHGQINNAFTHCNNFLSSKNQQHFHQAFQHVESCRTNMQTWGLDRTYFSVQELESKSQLLDDEIQKFLSHNREVELIKQNVNKLIEPAVAGSLSKSFENRKQDLNKNQNRWFWVSVVMAITSLVATLSIVSSIIGVFNNQEVIELIKGATNSSGILWYSVLLRIGILVPVYSLFAFSFGQYRKERNLEEIYAHKAAVATSLPNYGDLAVDNEVKDQILSEASKVIFTSPSSSSKSSSKSENLAGLEQVNQLMGSIHKLIPKSKE
ncbi:hypothetical protein C1S86_25495 [Vibrio parahaemolyticus]|uniref:hypothetical protein n=1 Tax=Vibrio parahaemolyticus TaxID=670 RepID=UPI0009936578|nr:hypothetical protein [Vibrio parahaemolyticus]OOQ68215.1 hypothetical protein BSR61_20505 [Vibrio parahaemolyticus]PMT73796.1 hypothetical protein C1S97_25720 [Vibrio parahaemolyticus]PMT78877.1 hypothetical protein C1S86_25495 [Vibrio parahaemolyticus]